MNFFLQLLQDMLLAAVPAVGFALVFNVPREALKYCALGGALGHGLRWALIHGIDMRIEWATFLAATTVSMVGVYWARKLRAHPKVFTVAAMIPMIPGIYAFTALLALAEIERGGLTDPLLAKAIENGLRTLFIVAGLAVGLAMPGLLFYRRKPLV
jgi:uncharacterized membrane protein YjjB (DUF3815 family)